MVILRRALPHTLRRGAWVIIPEQRRSNRLNGAFERGALIATFVSVLTVMPRHCARLAYFLHPKLREIDAVLITPKLLTLPLRRAGTVPVGVGMDRLLGSDRITATQTTGVVEVGETTDAHPVPDAGRLPGPMEWGLEEVSVRMRWAQGVRCFWCVFHQGLTVGAGGVWEGGGGGLA